MKRLILSFVLAAAVLFAQPAYVPPPGNVHNFQLQQQAVAVRNVAFEDLMGYVAKALAERGDLLVYRKWESTRTPENNWIYPIFFEITAFNAAAGTEYTTMLCLYHYDLWEGDAAKAAAWIASRIPKKTAAVWKRPLAFASTA